MAQLVPSIEQIAKLKQKPTAGEKALLKFLLQLNDEYTVYFQPFLNGNLPDIIILHPTKGILIIEVKDWDLDSYMIEKGKWHLKHQAHSKPIRSPIKQVKQYVKTTYSLIEGFVEDIVYEKSRFGYAKKAVYFHNETEENAQNFCRDCKHYDTYVQILGFDSLTPERMRKLPYFYRNLSSEFTESYYEAFQYLFHPSMHYLDTSEEISYSKQQLKLINDRSKELKIKGVAGSGKTSVLAKRAVNAHKRTNGNVLILTFNITLRNFIRDKLNQVREEFPWHVFTINNYHNFIYTMANQYGVEEVDLKDIHLFDGVEDIRKFDAIYIDEIQDYPIEWQTIIKKYFLAPKGEFVIFGDEKQTLYEIGLAGKALETVLDHKEWKEMNETFRLSSDVGELAVRYIDAFFIDKYHKSNMIIQGELSLDEGKIEKINLSSRNPSESYWSQIANFILQYARQHNIPPNDIVIIGRYIDSLRLIDYYIRHNFKLNTSLTFEKQETYEELLKQYSKESVRKEKLREIRKSKKIAFQMNAGTIKLSTIHSFKGWEGKNIFLLNELGNKDKNLNQGKGNNDELLYVGITRCINNLIIIDVESPIKYDQFFQQNVDIVTHVPPLPQENAMINF